MEPAPKMEAPAWDEFRCALDAYSTGDATDAQVSKVFRGTQMTAETEIANKERCWYSSWTLDMIAAQVKQSLRVKPAVPA